MFNVRSNRAFGSMNELLARTRKCVKQKRIEFSSEADSKSSGELRAPTRWLEGRPSSRPDGLPILLPFHPKQEAHVIIATSNLDDGVGDAGQGKGLAESLADANCLHSVDSFLFVSPSRLEEVKVLVAKRRENENPRFRVVARPSRKQYEYIEGPDVAVDDDIKSMVGRDEEKGKVKIKIDFPITYSKSPSEDVTDEKDWGVKKQNLIRVGEYGRRADLQRNARRPILESGLPAWSRPSRGVLISVFEDTMGFEGLSSKAVREVFRDVELDRYHKTNALTFSYLRGLPAKLAHISLQADIARGEGLRMVDVLGPDLRLDLNPCDSSCLSSSELARHGISEVISIDRFGRTDRVRLEFARNVADPTLRLRLISTGFIPNEELKILQKESVAGARARNGVVVVGVSGDASFSDALSMAFECARANSKAMVFPLFEGRLYNHHNTFQGLRALQERLIGDRALGCVLDSLLAMGSSSGAHARFLRLVDALRDPGVRANFGRLVTLIQQNYNLAQLSWDIDSKVVQAKARASLDVE